MPPPQKGAKPRRPRPDPRREPWAFDDAPPPQRKGLAIAIVIAVLGMTLFALIWIVLIYLNKVLASL